MPRRFGQQERWVADPTSGISPLDAARETPTSRKLKISQFYDNGTVGKYERARATAAEPSNMWLAQTSQADVCASLTFHRPW
jgi:hypothetical protein